jgi:geranylgeranyl pyrophosphate synthase
MTDERYDKMSLITQKTKEYISNFLQTGSIKKESVYDSFMYFYQRRYEKDVWLRPYLTASIYEHFAKKSFEDIIPMISVSEIFNISTYQSNLVFDNKIDTPKLYKANQFIASFISYNVANRIISGMNFDPLTKIKCFDILNSCNEKIYIGQYIDLNVLTFANIESLIKNVDIYFKEYFNRCKLIAGASVEYCVLSGAILAKVENENCLNELHRLSYKWGVLMQIINDLADYYCMRNGNRERYFDIRVDKVTLPLFLILKDVKFEEIEALKNKEKEQLDLFFEQYLYKDSTLAKQIFSIMINVWNKCKRHIDNLELSKEISLSLFENVFLNKYSRCFFSNELIKQV